MMNVLYASDDNYAPILSVSIASLFEHNIATPISVNIIDDGISDKNKDVISKLPQTTNHVINYIKKDVKNELRNINMKLDRGSISQFSRLFIQEILSPDYERVLYLDCDTLILDDLSELYNTDLHKNVAGGVLDAFSKWHYKALGLGENDIYINSGVMLIDLKRWKEEKIENRYIYEIIKRNGEILQGDQGLINIVLKGKVQMLPVRYDLMCYNYDFSYNEMMTYRKPFKYYKEQDISEAKESPAIIHFTTSYASMRPWQRDDCDHPYARKWVKLYNSNGFEVEDCEEKMTLKLYRCFPHIFILYPLRIVHSFIKPQYWMLKYRQSYIME